ncbi:hypothetical protein E2562_008596 [Oryza meyeriana var. granulata]|uniref:Uncharacterized protein n=1 Tax=Oryza meyeriana var. granulata TaxID=110450 RepID=A0A6G1C527_9ORYZ|nr:hypothetical protein E2562_008594 [Oryza meyeriana var. granulata]KAF0895282.1 hypothetical protein E2562_008596 [Oryza meyeriana var. granulata]
MGIFSMLAGCFRPSAAVARSTAYEAEKRRWVDEQVGLILVARVRDAYSVVDGKGAVDVSRYGGINLELALGYEFDRRWWFAQTTRLLAEAEAEAEAAPAGKDSGVKVRPLAVPAPAKP